MWGVSIFAHSAGISRCELAKSNSDHSDSIRSDVVIREGESGEGIGQEQAGAGPLAGWYPEPKIGRAPNWLDN